MSDASCILDGFGPLPTVRPGTVTALGEVIRQAHHEGQALYPIGGQTHQGLGVPPRKMGRAVDLTGLDQILDFPARDMTVTVQAGIRLGTLRSTLATEKLRLPIDVPLADRATLGGAIAVNASGSRRFGFGTLRDYVIGISALNDQGEEFKAGGRVVKNVAGYDICKLLVGSLGTLGIISQVTLKLRPLAEEHALVSLACSHEALESLLTLLHGSRTRPVAIELLNAATAQVVFQHANLAAPASPWVILVGFEGNGDAVQWQVQQLIQEVGTQCTLEARLGFTAEGLWKGLVEKIACPQATTTFKASVLPSNVASFCQSVERQTSPVMLQVHAGNGIVWGQFGGDASLERIGSSLKTWRDLAGVSGGHVIVQRCPSEWKGTLSVWGPSPSDAWLMRAVKEKFDPQRLFNPGRFVDGI